MAGSPSEFPYAVHLDRRAELPTQPWLRHAHCRCHAKACKESDLAKLCCLVCSRAYDLEALGVVSIVHTGACCFAFAIALGVFTKNLPYRFHRRGLLVLLRRCG